MSFIEDQNPLRSRLYQDLQNSEWLQKFKALSELLHRFRTELPLSEATELRWDTTHQRLRVECTHLAERTALLERMDAISSLCHPPSSQTSDLSYTARQVIIQYPNYPDVIVDTVKSLE